MGKLPDIEYAPVQRSSDTAAAPWDAARGLSKTVAEGLTLWGQELVKTQSQRASVQLSDQLNQIETDLSTRQYVSAQELRDALGEDIEKMPPHLRAQLTVKNAKGEDVDNEQIPMWAAFGPIYDRLAARALEASSSGIAMPGWRTEFKDRAAETIVGRKSRLNETQMRAAVQYMKTSQLADLEAMRNTARTSEEFSALRAAVMRSNVLSPEEKKAGVEAATEAEQVRPVIDATISADPVAVQEQIRRLEAGGADVDHIKPEHRSAYIKQLRTTLEVQKREAKVDEDKALKDNARMAWTRIFAAHDAARRAGRQLTVGEYNALIPKPASVPTDDWHQMDSYLTQLTKPVTEKPKTDYATYWNITQSLIQAPESFREGKVTVIGADGKPVQATLPQLFAAGRLAEDDYQKFVDLTRTAKAPGEDYVYRGAITDQEAINAALVEQKYDLKTKDEEQQKEIGHLSALINGTLAARAQAKKKPLEPGERDLIIHEVLDREVKVKKNSLMWRLIPFTDAETRTLSTLGVRPEVAVALYEGTAKGGRRMTPEEVVSAATEYTKFEPGILSTWGRYGAGKPLPPDTAVHIFYLIAQHKTEIDDELRRAGKLTGDDEKDNPLRAALAVRAYVNRGLR